MRDKEKEVGEAFGNVKAHQLVNYEEKESRLAVKCLSSALFDHGYLILTNVVQYGRYIFGRSEDSVAQFAVIRMYLFGASELSIRSSGVVLNICCEFATSLL